MSFLTDAVSQAEQQIQTNTRGLVNAQIQGVTGAIANAKNTAVSSVVGAVNNTVKTAVGSVVGSVGQLLTGNVSGAASTLLNAPQNVLNSAFSGLGGYNATDLALSSPGTVSSMSSNGGINPGDDLAGAQNRPDPMLNFTWYCQLPVINPGSTQAQASATATSVLANLSSSVLTSSLGGSVSVSNSAQLPWYYVEGAACPFRQYDSITIFREGRDRKYPSKYSVDNLHLSIYADSQNQAFTYLQAWNNAIITPFGATSAATMGGAWGRPSDYKKPIYIYLLDVTNNVLATLEYVECWPVSVEQYTLESGNSNRVVNRVNFSVGDVFINLQPVSPNLISGVLATAPNLLSSPINTLGGIIGNVTSNVVQRGASAISSGISSLF